MRRQLVCWGGVVSAAVLGAVSAAADPAMPTLQRSELRYRAPKGCPSPERFLREVNARAMRPRPMRLDAAFRQVTVHIEREGRQVVGVLEVPDREGGSSRRLVEAPSCREVATALALVTAVALDTDTEDELREAPASSMQAPMRPFPSLRRTAAYEVDHHEDIVEEKVPAPEPPKPVAVIADTKTKSAATDPSYASDMDDTQTEEGWMPLDRGPEDPIVAVFGPRTPRGWWGVGLHADAMGGVLPGVAFAPRLFVDARFDPMGVINPAFRLSAARAVRRDSINGSLGTVEFTWTAGRADLCQLAWQFSEHAALWPCATFEAGAVSAQGAEAQVDSDPKLWLAAGALARAQWIVADVLLLELEAGGAAPLTRSRIRTNAGEIRYQAELMDGYVSAGIGGRFP